MYFDEKEDNMIKKERILALAMVAAMVPGMTAAAGEKDTRGEGKRFVSITYNSTNMSAITLNNAAEKVFTEAGAEFTALYYESNIETMMSMIENAVSSDCDGIIIQNNMNLEAGVDALKEALDKGMVIVEYDSDYEQIPEIQYCFLADQYGLGYMIGEMAGEWANEVLIPAGLKPIAGNFEYRNTPDFVSRTEAIVEGLTDVCPEAEVVRAEQPSNTSEAMNMAENWMQTYPDMNVFVGVADTFTIGGAEAFTAAGKDPAVTGCFGADAIPEALEQIAKGTVYKGTVFIDSEKIGTDMAEYMLDYVNDITVEGREKYNYFGMKKVTAENIDEYYTAE